ncbi:MFS transporter [Streptomyces sp. NPDC046316]|uniref:MFS transporter n=1 Tax=Streptomyces sp. NPDC046316 TaxID=3154494 RepID=UPI0033DE3232
MDIQVEGPRQREAWARVGAVTLGIFTVMTAELLPVGLFTPVAAELNVSPGAAGLMVTVPVLVATVSAPLIAVRAAGADRRAVLVVLMSLVAAATAAAAHFAVVLGARVLLGVAIGGLWALAGGLAPRLVPAADVGRATAVVVGGVSAASVLGALLGGLLLDATTPTALLSTGAALTLAACLAAVLSGRKHTS